MSRRAEKTCRRAIETTCRSRLPEAQLGECCRIGHAQLSIPHEMRHAKHTACEL
jgi:hypothetical protein